jgi:hypothetical protein
MGDKGVVRRPSLRTGAAFALRSPLVRSLGQASGSTCLLEQTFSGRVW